MKSTVKTQENYF